MYIDPGSGSVILQALLGILLSIFVFTRIFWGRLKTAFYKQKPAKSETEEED
jgi:hypothetical protein